MKLDYKEELNMENERFCENCGKKDVIETEDGRFLCADCATEFDYCFCEDCEQWKYGDEFHGLHRRNPRQFATYLCEDCLNDNSDYVQCSECGEWFDSSYSTMIDTAYDTVICLGCYEKDYVTCEKCGDVITVDDSEWDGGTDAYYCSSCYKKIQNIKGYSYKPQPIFTSLENGEVNKRYLNTNDTELMFGVELEIDDGDAPEDCADLLVSKSDDIYLKHDGSLSSDGIEIVTHPCSLEYHLKKLGWETISKTALSYGYRSHEAGDCGLHVHVGKQQLGLTNRERDYVVAKITMLIDRHWQKLKKFSRRRESQIRDWAAPPELGFEEMEDLTEDEALEITREETANRSRYQALNLHNFETIEFRIFNGTLKVSTIYATLQFVSNMCEYAMKHTVKDCLASQWEDIVFYEEYDELKNYLEERELLETEYKEPIKICKEGE